MRWPTGSAKMVRIGFRALSFFFRGSLLLLCVMLIKDASAEQLTGRVISIADGDTVTLLTDDRK